MPRIPQQSPNPVTIRNTTGYERRVRIPGAIRRVPTSEFQEIWDANQAYANQDIQDYMLWEDAPLAEARFWRVGNRPGLTPDLDAAGNPIQ